MVPSVTKDEGLHSPKAIAFIVNKLNPRRRLDKKKYSTLQTLLKTVTELLEKSKKIENRPNVPLTKNLGDNKWTN